MDTQHREVPTIPWLRLAVLAVAVYLAIRFLGVIAAALMLFGVSLLLAAVLDRPVTWLAARRVPRGAAAILIVVGLVAVLVGVVALAVPPLADEVGDLASRAPAFAARLQRRTEVLAARYPAVKDQLSRANFGAAFTSAAQPVLAQVGRFSLGLVGGIVALILVVAVALYTVADPRPLVRSVLGALPRDRRMAALRVLVGVTRQLRAWVRATFWMMLVVGVCCGLGLWVLGVRSAALFGVIAGIGEAIPTIGPILSAIPPVLITLADDPTKALGVVLLFVVVQLVENNVLVPRIMAASMDLHPVSVLFFVIVMGALLGPFGVLLATPACAVAKVLYRELYLRGRARTELRG